MTVKELEATLTETIANNPQDPQIYELLKQLALRSISYNHFGLNKQDAEECAHTMASDMYFRIAKGWNADHWIACITRVLYINYVPKQKDSHYSEVIDTTGNTDLNRGIYQMSAAAGVSVWNSIKRKQNVQYLLEINSVIKQAVDDSRFPSNTPEGLALYTSVCLSLLRGQDVFFRLDPDLQPYVHIIIQQVKSLIVSSGFAQDSDETDALSSKTLKASFDHYRLSLYCPETNELS